MSYDFEQMIERKNSGCFKYDAMYRLYNGRSDLIPLWVADMDFAVSPEIITAIKQRLDHPIMGYNWNEPEYHQPFVDYVKNNHQWEIKSEWLLMSPGIVPAINFLILALTEQGDKIMVQHPVYNPFDEAITSHHREVVVNDLVESDGSYTIDFLDFEEKVKNGVKIFILCSPHNPIGKVWKENELIKMAHICKKYNVLMISDEIHNDLVYKPYKHISIGSKQDYKDNIITLMAPSKTFNIAGMGASYIIIPNQFLRDKVFQYFMDIHIFGPGTLGLTACNAAYKYGKPWLEELLVYLQDNIDYLYKRINSINGLKMKKPEATFLAWIDFRELGLSDEEICHLCIEANLALNSGISYGNNGSGFMRLNFGCPRSVLKQAIDNLEKVINER